MALTAGSITVNTSTGGEIRAAGLACDLYDAILAAGASGGRFCGGCSSAIPSGLGMGSPELAVNWDRRKQIAVLCNAMAPAIVSWLAGGGYT